MSFPTSGAVGQSSDSTTTPQANLGEVQLWNTGSFRYGKAGAALAAGDLCAFTTDGTFVASKQGAPAAGAQLPLGVPQAAMAINTYGWFFCGDGTFNLNCASGLGTPGTKLTTTGTAGQAGSGGVAFGACTVGTTAGAGAVISCFAPSKLATNVYA